MFVISRKKTVAGFLSVVLSLFITTPSFAVLNSNTSNTDTSKPTTSKRYFKPPSQKNGARILSSDALLKEPHKDNELLIRFKDATPQQAIDQVLNESSIEKFKESYDNVIKLKFKSGTDLKQKLNNLLANSAIEFAEPNFIVKASYVPNDTLYGNQWALPKINAPTAWNETQGSSNVIVAVIDTGIDHKHPDLEGRTVQGVDFYNGDFDPWDDNGHGTMTAGIIGATMGNSLGIAGLASGVKIMPLKVFNSNGSAYNSDIADAIYYAVDNGAKVINMSLGGVYSSAIAYAASYARFAGVVAVAASGNYGSSSPSYPAALPSVISVGATDNTDTRTNFSNYGYTVDLMAPGANIASTVPVWAGSYATGDGTSFSAPHVSGLAALLLSKHPNATPGQVEQYIKESAVDLEGAGRDSGTGWGRIDAYKALTTTLQSGDVFEPNDYPDTAKTITAGNYSPTLYPSGDLDVYKVNLTAGQTLRVKVDPPSGLDPVIELYNQNVEFITSVNSYEFDGTEILTYTASTSGTYFILVTDYYGAASKTIYTMSIGIAANPAAPSIVSISPQSGVSNPYLANTFSAVYADANGFRDIQYAYFTLSTNQPGAPAVMFCYDQSANKLLLANDSLTGWMPTTVTPGTNSSVSNSYTTINGLGTSVTGSGNNLTVNWNVAFKTSMSGRAFSTYLMARDLFELISPSVQVGTWNVNQRPGFYKTNPSLTVKAGNPVTIDTSYVEHDGLSDLQGAYYLINFEMAKSICVQYDQNANKLWLRDDQGITWLGGIAPGTNIPISNSYVTLDAANTTVIKNGTTLSVSWKLIPKAAFAGKTYQMFLYVRDNPGQFKGWESNGTLKISQ